MVAELVRNYDIDDLVTKSSLGFFIPSIGLDNTTNLTIMLFVIWIVKNHEKIR